MNPQPRQVPPGFPPELAAYMAVILVAALIGLAIGIVILVFFCLTMSKALKQVAPRNRLMEPGMVWLMFVPCVNLVWGYFVAIQVPGSLEKEFRERGTGDGSDCGKAVGLTWCILNSVSIPLSLIPFVNLCSGVLSLAALVCFIIFWVKIAGYSSKLASGESRGGRSKSEEPWNKKFDDDD